MGVRCCNCVRKTGPTGLQVIILSLIILIIDLSELDLLISESDCLIYNINVVKISYFQRYTILNLLTISLGASIKECMYCSCNCTSEDADIMVPTASYNIHTF